MPYPPPQRRSPGPRRRSLLASAAGAALLTGCSSDSDDASRAERDGGTSSAAEQSRARAARDSAALLERYDAVLAVHPALAVRLAPLRAEVLRHVEAFGGTRAAASSGAVVGRDLPFGAVVDRGFPSAPSASATASGPASGQPSAVAVPPDPGPRSPGWPPPSGRWPMPGRRNCWLCRANRRGCWPRWRRPAPRTCTC